MSEKKSTPLKAKKVGQQRTSSNMVDFTKMFGLVKNGETTYEDVEGQFPHLSKTVGKRLWTQALKSCKSKGEIIFSLTSLKFQSNNFFYLFI